MHDALHLYTTVVDLNILTNPNNINIYIFKIIVSLVSLLCVLKLNVDTRSLKSNNKKEKPLRGEGEKYLAVILMFCIRGFFFI